MMPIPEIIKGKNYIIHKYIKFLRVLGCNMAKSGEPKLGRRGLPLEEV